MAFGEKMMQDMRKLHYRQGGSQMRKIKYVKPGVVGGSSVHPC
jgi:hypothetical protein